MFALHGVTHYDIVTHWSTYTWKYKLRSAQTREHVAGTWSDWQIAATVFMCDMPVFAKTFCCGDKLLSSQHLAWNSAGLNSCLLKQWQNDLNFQCRIVYTNLANCVHYDTFLCLNPLRVHQLACCPCPGGGTTIYGLYRYVPLWRVWFSSSLLYDRVYKSERLGLE